MIYTILYRRLTTGAQTNPFAPKITVITPNIEVTKDNIFLSVPKKKQIIIISKLINKNNFSNKFQLFKKFFINPTSFKKILT